jgi:2-polyprenyl-3-methyl-5-hydroxy-6-metoxy-1,4-benzoquinol methylase
VIRRDLHQHNRLAWDAATPAHSSHKADEAGFFRAGGTTLFDDEVHLILGTGPEGQILDELRASGQRPLAGLRLLHATCNAGQDTLSLAQLGADVTGVGERLRGVDISPLRGRRPLRLAALARPRVRPRLHVLRRADLDV